MQQNILNQKLNIPELILQTASVHFQIHLLSINK